MWIIIKTYRPNADGYNLNHNHVVEVVCLDGKILSSTFLVYVLKTQLTLDFNLKLRKKLTDFVLKLKTSMNAYRYEYFK